MSYILESQEEFHRLERQSQNPAYDFRKELENLVVPRGSRILDAGCGSGVVTRFLGEQYAHSEVHGCDLSSHRIEMAKRAAQGFSNISFTCASISEMPFPESSFDFLVSRYVFQHLGEKGIAYALKEFQRVLKPGGTLLLIDGDGLFVNLFPQSSLVKKSLDKMSRSGMVDFSVGRKLPFVMHEAGFQNIEWRLETANHSGESRFAEAKLMEERFVTASEQLEKILGKKAAQRFAATYVADLRKPSSCYFTQTFIVKGTKPEKVFRLVRS